MSDPTEFDVWYEEALESWAFGDRECPFPEFHRDDCEVAFQAGLELANA